ncbi:helix-turn-helix transcriptional regulator [Bosea sp. BK604]|uniref:S24 family peptidase n=1 Tax=Bosea sp. BK604 TaxID=2512180 RepID=UPI001048E2CB|nr:helix-turn-helix transcriptional regulator [Bosea sp. BK604]TCR60841.1 phage repressor protein C with HTH and peptisase S24 domain [Bosea sp. BK604]
MLSHEQIWSAIDALAQRYGFTPSGLARKAGLDATTFNRSKRVGPDGRERWPSTESIAKILAATGASLDEFIGVMRRGAAPAQTIPLIGFAQAGSGGFFDDGGLPVGESWDEVAFPGVPDEKAYALEIAGDSMLPLYRDGDTIIVSPTAAVRRGDRVVVKTTEGEVLAKQLKRETAKTIELASLNPERPDRVLARSEIAFMARVIWASQ